MFQVQYVSYTNGDETHEQYYNDCEDMKLYAALPRLTLLMITISCIAVVVALNALEFSAFMRL